MHPRRFIKELTDAMPRGSIVATDIGNNSSICNSYLRFAGARQHISALSWGNCGFAYGAALGAKMGSPTVRCSRSRATVRTASAVSPRS